MRLIDADALIGALHNYAFLEGDDRSICYNVIQRQPTVDAVPVIRCEDCKYSSDNRVYGCRIESFNYDFDTQMYANDFCSCGERRSNG